MILYQTFTCFFHGIETEIVVQDISYWTLFTIISFLYNWYSFAPNHVIYIFSFEFRTLNTHIYVFLVIFAPIFSSF